VRLGEQEKETSKRKMKTKEEEGKDGAAVFANAKFLSIRTTN
jgi:hypothetical protein